MKRKILLLALVAICVATLAAGSLAYFTSESAAHNVITTGGVDIALLEWADTEKTQPFADRDGILPGASVTKIAEVKNTGPAAAWVRVRVEKVITLRGEGEPDTALLALDLNTADWTPGADGYYYYNAPLAAGETTAPLFTTVSFSRAMGNEYQNATAAVNLTAQAVQTANNGSAAADAVGWPA